MMSRFQQWLAEQRATRRSAPRAALVLSITTLVLALAREILINAGAALISGPLWLGLVAMLALVAGLLILGRRDRPQPDDPPASDAVGGHPVLPPAPPPLIGRDRDLQDLVELVDAHHMVAVVGRRAVGTSVCALQVAHQIADRFPDGHVYLDLRAAAAGRPPMTPARVLRRVLHLAGLTEPRSDRPNDLDAGTDALHAWLANRKVLFLFDNVDKPEHVRRLRLGGPGCRVLLAGSVDLEDLPNIKAYILHELTEDAAVELLSSTIGTTVAVEADRPVAVDLVNVCGRQPEAIRLLGRLVRDRHWSLRHILETMQQGLREPLGAHGSEFSAALRSLWDACDITYRDLSPVHRKLFRLLALVPATEIGTHATAAVAGMPPERAADLLDALARRGLVESARPGHYRIRRLLATSARFRMIEEDPPRQLRLAALRLVRYYALMAEGYADQLTPAPQPAGHEHDHERAVAEARLWFQHEQELLFHLITNPDVVPPPRGHPGAETRPAAIQPWLYRLAVAVCVWYAAEDRLADWQEVCEAVLMMRLAWTNPAVAFWAHNELAVVRRLRGEPLEAWRELRTAVQMGGGRGRRGLAQAETNLGLALFDHGQVDAAVQHLERGLQMRSRSDRRGQALSALALGAAYLRADELDVARRHLNHAVNLFELLGDMRGMAAALNNLGVVLSEQGDRLGAAERWEIARGCHLSLADEEGLSSVLLNIAADLLANDRGRAVEAVDLLTESIRLRRVRPETRGAGLAHLYLGDALSVCGKPEQAAEHWRTAARILAPLGGFDAAVVSRRLALDG